MPTPEVTDSIYPAGSSITLMCHVDGNYVRPLRYQWSSTCSGACFVTSQQASMISTSILHSTDSGDHACYVEDDVGHTGEDTYTVTVTGNPMIDLQD